MRSLVLREAAISAALEMAAIFRKPLQGGLVDHGLECKAAALTEFAERLRDLPEAPEAIDFCTALDLAKKRFRAHPYWRAIVGTPWENDGPVIAAEMMCCGNAQNNLPRGIAGAVGGDTTGPTEAMTKIQNAD